MNRSFRRQQQVKSDGRLNVLFMLLHLLFDPAFLVLVPPSCSARFKANVVLCATRKGMDSNSICKCAGKYNQIKVTKSYSAQFGVGLATTLFRPTSQI
jgi:hypothetical protein